MPPELRQARLVHIVQHTSRAARDFATLLQTLELALAVGLGFAVHVVVIVGFAACSNEEGGAEEGCGGGADFLDCWDGGREGGSVDEDLLVEPTGDVSGAIVVCSRYTYLGCLADILTVLGEEELTSWSKQ